MATSALSTSALQDKLTDLNDLSLNTAEIKKTLKSRDLFENEQIIGFCTQVKEDTFLHAYGLLVLTKLQLIFVSVENRLILPIPMGQIVKIDEPGSRMTTAGKYMPAFVDAYFNGNNDGSALGSDDVVKVVIQCSDFRQVAFSFPRNSPERKTFLSTLKAYLQRIDVNSLFQLQTSLSSNGSMTESLSKSTNLHSAYNPIEEYARLKLDEANSAGVWRLSHCNKTYSLCDTYPAIVCVPAAIPDQILMKACAHRSRERFIATVWRHPTTGATISRCSQPKVGLTSTRNYLDEEFIQTIATCNPNPSRQIFIIDCRPKLNARANAAIGGGHESEDHYKNTIVEFADIQNIHDVRESWNQLRRLVLSSSSGMSHSAWLAGLANTKWLDHISSILAASRRVVDIIERIESSCVVHCSDGWDRTSQIVSLAELMMDPYYRTIHGFSVLIEKDWISFGHQFSTRHGIFEASDKNQRAPIFLQFLESVWQLMRQFPSEFEFNEALLIGLVDHATTHMFASFIFDNEMSRKLAPTESASSFWDILHLLKNTCMNPSFAPNRCSRCLIPSLLPYDVILWRTYYLRWTSSASLNLPLLGTGGLRGFYLGQIGISEEIHQIMQASRVFMGSPQPLTFPFGHVTKRTSTETSELSQSMIEFHYVESEKFIGSTSLPLDNHVGLSDPNPADPTPVSSPDVPRRRSRSASSRDNILKNAIVSEQTRMGSSEDMEISSKLVLNSSIRHLRHQKLSTSSTSIPIEIKLIKSKSERIPHRVESPTSPPTPRFARPPASKQPSSPSLGAARHRQDVK